MEKGFTSGDRDHGGTAFIGCREAFIHAKAPMEDLFRIGDLTAAGTGKITAKQGFQHQDQRIPLLSMQLLNDHVTGDTVLLNERDPHDALLDSGGGP
jgi:hypothetical protein